MLLNMVLNRRFLKIHFLTNLQTSFAAEMVEKVRVKEDQRSTAQELRSVFPTFCWVLRDVFLQEKIDGKDVTPKEYLEHCLKLKPVRLAWI